MTVGMGSSSCERYKFSPQGHHLAVSTPDGRLGIWGAAGAGGVVDLLQEYVPSSHLSAACTCVVWSPIANPARKKKKKRDADGEPVVGGGDLVALGTTAGTVLVYSVSQGDLATVFSQGHTQRVNDVAWSDSGTDVWAAGQDGTVVKYSVKKLALETSFKTGKEPIFSIRVLSDNSGLVTASRSIKVWDLPGQTVRHSFTGHAAEVTSLALFSPGPGRTFVVSAAEDDRTVSLWRIPAEEDEEEDDHSLSSSSWSSFSVNDGVRGVEVGREGDDTLVMAVITKSGTAQVFRHNVTARKQKPVKPKNSLQVVSEKDASGKVLPIPLLGCQVVSKTVPDIIFSYGSSLKPLIERLPVSELEKNHALVRQPLVARIVTDTQAEHTKTVTPDTHGDVVFLSPGVSQPSAANKLGKKRKSQQENVKIDSLPIEDRLKLLATETGPDKTPPRTDTLAQLLVQGLHGKDDRIVDSVLDRADEQLIDNTVRRIPAEAVVPLVNTLQRYVKGRGVVNASHAKWLRSVLTIHTGFLMSLPDCQDLLGPVYALLEARTASYSSVLQLRGKLDMIMKQKSGRCEDTVIDTEKEALVVHQDDSSDELSDVLEDLLVPMSDTDDNWDDDDINAEDTNNDDEDDEDEDDEDDVKLVNGGAKSDSNDEIEMDSD